MSSVEAGPARPRAARVRRPACWLVVLASVGWTVLSRSQVEAALHDGETVGPLVGVLSGLLVVWALGLAVACWCAAARTAMSLRRDPRAWIRSFHDLGRSSTGVLADLAGSRPFRLGWWVSWIATTLASALPAVVAVVRLGVSGLGVVGLAAASIGVNLSWRLPIEVRLRQLRVSSRDLRPAVLVGD